MINKCTICGSAEIGNYFDSDERVKKCLVCGTGFLNSNLLGANPINYEEGSNYAAVLDDEARLHIISENAKDQLRLITRFIIPKDKKLLDVGAHTGQFVREANNFGFKAEGVEPNERAVDQAKRKGIPVNKMELSDIDSGNKFDVVTLFHVLEHLTDPVSAILKIKDILVSDGYFIIEVPNSNSYLSKLDGSSWKFIALEHLFYFNEKSLRKILERSGFSVVYSKKRNYEIDYLNPRKLMRYLLGKKINRDRFLSKMPDNNKISNGNASILKRITQKLMARLIHVLGREDHIFIIAKKND